MSSSRRTTSPGPDVRLAYPHNSSGSAWESKLKDALRRGRGPDVRLAIGGNDRGPAATAARLSSALGPDVRLAVPIHNVGNGVDVNVKRALAPEVRLAHVPGAQGDNPLRGQRGVKQLPESSAPALLVSFYYLEPFLKARSAYVYRDWALDSGAFSAMNSGKVIDLEAYVVKAKELLATDPKLTEVFALDVIGDWRASVRNAERMWAEGIPAIPTFHGGSPWDVLVGLARDYPKVALGGVALHKAGEKERFAGQCFARVWPKKLHGFGYGAERYLVKFPFHSVDATSWEVGACKFGNWRSFGKMSVRGSAQNLRAEVEHYLRMEREARTRWAKEMAKLEALDAPVVRMAEVKSGRQKAKPWQKEG